LILGAGWAFLGLLAVGLAALVLVPGCGLVVVSKAPGGEVRLEAPSLVEVDPAVEAKTTGIVNVSLARAGLHARRAALRIRNAGCDGVRSGSGFALGAKLLIADREVIPGAGALRVASRAGAPKKVAASRVYRLGEFGIAQVEDRLPRTGATEASAGSGASVAVVGYPLSATPRLLPGVVVDTVAGAPFGVNGRVMRLTSTLRHGEPGGPVIDAKGRIVAVAFTTDPGTGLAIAAPIGTLRSLVAARSLEALPPCDGS
jgi:serine protease DegQ